MQEENSCGTLKTRKRRALNGGTRTTQGPRGGVCNRGNFTEILRKFQGRFDFIEALVHVSLIASAATICHPRIGCVIAEGFNYIKRIT